MDIQLLYNKVNAAVQLLDMFEEILIGGVSVVQEESERTLGNGVLILFSDIVDWYSLFLVDELENQEQFWMQQLERNLGAIERGDMFYLIDVLAIETKQAMIQFQNKLIKTGLVFSEEIYE